MDHSKVASLHAATKLTSFAVPNAALSLSTTLLQILDSESIVLQDVTAAFVPGKPTSECFHTIFYFRLWT